MHKKTVYLADYDGRQFENIEDCEKYEELINKVLEAIKKLGTERVKDSNIGIRHNLEDVKEAYKNFMNICAETIPEYEDTFIECGEGKRHHSHASRILDDVSYFLYHIDGIFACINKETGIEYQQPYFALHPEDFNGKILNIVVMK